MGERGHLFWDFPKSFSLRVEAPACLGVLKPEDALLRDATLARGEAGSYEEGNKIIFTWLIDKKGIVLEALFTAFGDAALVGCAELVCETSIGKSIGRALGTTRLELETLLSGGKKELPGRVKRLISLVLAARDQVCNALSSQLQQDPQRDLHPEWDALSKEERLRLIRGAIEEYIQPHLRRDGGGVEVVDLVDGHKVRILFQGACVDCIGSSGSTFSYIQHLLRQKVHSSLEISI